MSAPLPAANGPDRQARLDELPTEMLLEIYKNCPDFSSSWALANTSRRLSLVFDTYAAEIVEAVLKSTVPHHVAILMNGVVKTRTDSLGDVDFINLILFAYSHHSGYTNPTLPLSLMSQPLSHEASPALLRRFMGLAHNIHLIAHLCIETCLQRFTSALGTPAGPPSWLTEQRTIISLWRLQFCFELRRRAHINGYTQGNETHQYTTEGFFFASYFIRDQVLTVADFVDELRITNPRPELSLSEGPTSRPSTKYWLPDLDKLITAHYDRKTLSPQYEKYSSFPHDQVDRIVKSPLCSGILCSARPPNAQQKDHMELHQLPLQPYRKFGVFIWGPEVMVPLGLYHPGHNFPNWPIDDNVFCRDKNEAYHYFKLWKQLLTEEEVEEALAEQKARWTGQQES